MSKLTDSQLIILSAAAARDDGGASVPPKMAKAAASKVGSSLIVRKLMREVKAKPGMPVWREDAAGRAISLMITASGRKAIGADEAVAEETTVVARSPERSNPRPGKHAQIEKSALKSVSAQSPRAGSKQALLIEMLSEKTGATLDALVEATGWLAHTTRAALTGLRKRGFSIERKREGEASVYRIDQKASAAAAA